MHLVVRLLLALVAVLALSGSAPKGGRVALVIGNGDYANAGSLANPVNDAHDIADKLRAMGFTVVDGYNLGKRDLEGRIGDFADALDGASSGLFYYAGHGIAVDGRNFVVPTDAHLDMPAKLKLEAIPIDDIMDLMRQQTGTAILILDACRNNPFARSLTAKATTRGVQAAEGLAQIEGGKGTFIAFSTAPGAVAMDGTGRNSPFAEALLRHMDEPGQSINDLMIAVRRDVVDETKDFQTPMSWDSLTEKFAFVTGGAAAPAETVPAQQPQATAPADPEAALRDEIRGFVTEHYLKPDAAHFETATAALFADTVTSYGREYPRDELVSIKAKWFSQWSKWKLNLLPNTFKIMVLDESSVTATFDMRYKYSPKDTGTSPIAGTAHVTLDLVKEGGAWKIEMENSRVD
jgi:uncharacterized caspase-like protein